MAPDKTFMLGKCFGGELFPNNGTVVISCKMFCFDVHLASCFTAGAVAFTPEVITWYMPKHIDPLFSSDAFTMLEVYMGIDAKRLNTEEMAARNYSVLVTEAHIIVAIPVGAVGGYFKVSIG